MIRCALAGAFAAASLAACAPTAYEGGGAAPVPSPTPPGDLGGLVWILVVLLALALVAALWFNPAVKAMAVKMIGRRKDSTELIVALRQLEAKARKLEADLEGRRLEAERLRALNDELTQENARLRDDLENVEMSRRNSSPVRAPPPSASASRPPPAPVMPSSAGIGRGGDMQAVVRRLLESWAAIERLSDRPMEYRRALRESGVLALVQKGETLERLGDELITNGIVEYFGVPDSASGLYGLFVGPQFVNKRETLADTESLTARLAQFFQLSTQERLFRQVSPALVQFTKDGVRVSHRGDLSI